MSAEGAACQACGAPLRKGARFCPSCGTSIFEAKRAVNKSPSRRWLVWVLAGSGFLIFAALLSGVLEQREPGTRDAPTPADPAAVEEGKRRIAEDLSVTAFPDEKTALAPAAGADGDGVVEDVSPAPEGREKPKEAKRPKAPAPRPAKKAPPAEPPAVSRKALPPPVPPPAPRPGSRLAAYRNDKFGFATVLPAHWQSEVKQGPGWSAHVFSGPGGTNEYLATVTFQFVSRTGETDAAAQARFFVNDMEQYPNFELKREQGLRVGGRPAAVAVVDYRPLGEQDLYRQEQLIIEGEEYFYWVGYTAPASLFDTYHEAMERAVANFRLLEQGE